MEVEAINCECRIERLKATVDCPKGFRCCARSDSAGMQPVRVYGGANAVQCLEPDRLDCPISPAFCEDIVFCRCPLRRYLSLELNT